MLRRLAWAAAVAVVPLAGCGANGSFEPRVATGAATVSFSVSVPRVQATGTRRTPAYIAASTQSIALSIAAASGGQVVQTATFNVTPTSGGCSTSASVTTCTESIVLAPGSYDVTTRTYDGLNASGNELSEQTSFAFSAQLGVANEVALTLYGVPHSIAVTATSSNVRGDQTAGFTIYGSTQRSFSLTAYDADGAAIVGAGAPTWSVASSSGSGLTLAQHSSGTFGLTATTNDDVESFTATASFSDATVCSQIGAVCSRSFSASHIQYLFFYLGGNRVLKMAPPYVGTSATLVYSQAVTWIATGADGDLFVYDGAYVHDLPPPYTSVASQFAVSSSREIAADGNGNVFATGSGQFYESTAGSYGTATPVALPTTAPLTAAVADGSRAIFATSSKLYVYNTSPLALLATLPAYVLGYSQAGVDDAGDVATFDGRLLFASASSNYATTALNYAGTPLEIGMNHRGDIIVAPNSGAINEVYTPPYTANQSAAFSVSLTSAIRYAFDISDDWFAGTPAGVYLIPYPYQGQTLHQLEPSAVNPGNLALTP